MDEIKRGRVPWGRSQPQERVNDAKALQAQQQAERAAALRARKRPVLDNSKAVAFRGNALTGAALDARKDLPPFLYNPPPQEVLERRRAKLAATYAKPMLPPVHPSAADPLQALFDPATRKAAKLQRLINTNPVVRAAFERAAGAKVVMDRRADGTLTLTQPSSNVAVKSSAITSGAPPQRNFYDMLAALDQEVLDQAARVAAATQSSTGAYNPSAVPPSFPFGLGIEGGLGEGPNGLTSGDEDEESEDEDGFGSRGPWSSNASGFTAGLPTGPANVPTLPATATGSTSTDVEAQKVTMLVQRVNQMYQLISGMFSKHHQAAGTALNNLK